MDLTWIANPESWLALLTLTILEIVLGIDNIVFISILAGKLPEDQQDRARRTGLAVALITRVLLLLSISWLAKLTTPLFEVEAIGLHPSGRDLILAGGGLFLLYKATKEIHDKLEGEEHTRTGAAAASFMSVIIQIALLDIVFSLDSVLTAIGMADHVEIMIAAIVIAIGIMMFAAGPISRFVHRHPTVKMLALSFLLMIGLTLIVEAFHVKIPKGYIYFAMGFSIFVELLNLRIRTRGTKPVDLHEPVLNEGKTAAESAASSE